MTTTIEQFILNKGGAFVNTFTEYRGKQQRLFVVFECNNGHLNEKRVDTMIGAGVSGKTWCLECNRNTLNDARDLAHQRGFKFLSKTYENCRIKYDWQCSSGHIWKAKYSNIKTGRGCPTCLRTPFETIQKLAESKGGKCLTLKEDFINTKQKFTWKCSDGHIWKTTYNSINHGSWCGECTITIGERTCCKIFEFIYKQKFPKKRPDWLISDVGGRMELDGYCKELKIAYETQGAQHYKFIPYWHKTVDKFNECKNRDKIKAELCQKNGVYLIDIPYTVKYEDLYSYIYSRCKNIPEGTPTSIDYKLLDIKSLNKDRLLMIQDYVHQKWAGKLLSTTYVNNTTRLDFECKEGHKFKQSWGAIIADIFCKKCTYEPIRINMTKRLKEFAEKHDLTILDEYINAKIKINWKCNRCDKNILRTWDVFKTYEGKEWFHCK